MAAKYHVHGRLIDTNGAGLAGLRVEAWDKDLLLDDLLGSTVTDAQGRFNFVFTTEYFAEWIFDQHPDIFFRVYRGDRLLGETSPHTLAEPEAEAEVEITLQDSEDDGPPGYPPRDQFEPQPEQDPVNLGPPRPLPEDDGWRDAIRDWLADREANRTIPDWEDLKERLPRPWLDCTSNFGPQIVGLHLNQPGDVKFTVWNSGNLPAFTCCVELYEGPGGYSHPLSDYQLRGRKIITLYPGERRDVSLPWVRKQTSGRIVGIVYDPLLDPIDFTNVEQYNRHITSVHWSSLE